MDRTKENLRRIRAYNKSIRDTGEWVEEDHPRSKNGQFTSGAGESALKQLAEVTEPKYLGMYDPQGNPLKRLFGFKGAPKITSNAELETALKEATHSGAVKSVLDSLGCLNSKTIKNTILPEEVESAKICVRSIFMALNDFPEAANCINSIKGGTDKQLRGNLAAFDGISGDNALKFNSEAFVSGEEIEALYAAGVEAGMYPPGTDARSILIHEIAHALVLHIRTMDAGKTKFDFCDHIFYNVCGFKDNTPMSEIEKTFSGYAAKNHEDMVCEALSEALVSATPRPMCMKVYSAVKEKLKGE